MNFFEHKLLHGLVGAGLGAIRGDIAAGALGGMVSELIADLTKDDVKEIAAKVVDKANAEGIQEGTPEFQNLINNELRSTIEWSKLGAAVTTFLAGRDVNVGIEAATNALEHNCLPLLLLAVAAEVTSVTMSLYDASVAYEEDGIEGAAESLATDAIIGAATAGAGKLVIKGGKAAWSGAKKAVDRVKGARASKAKPKSHASDQASSSTDVDLPAASGSSSAGDIASSSTTSAAKSNRNILRPDPNAEGAHTTFKVDESGNIRNYETYTTNPRNPTGFDTVKRVDFVGKPHTNKATGERIPVPHVVAKDIPGGVRPALPGEIPQNFKPTS